MKKELFTVYRVKFTFLTRLCAGMPADPDLVSRMLEARKSKTKAPQSKTITEIHEEVMATIPAEAEQTMNVFQRVNGELMVGMRTVRAHIKEMASILSSLYVGKLEGEKSFAVRAKNAIYYPPELYWVPILDSGGKPFREATANFDKPVHIMTPLGPRNSIKTFEFLSDAAIEFPLWVMKQMDRVKDGKVTIGKAVVSQEDIETLFEYGGVHGYGAERGDGEGKYVATVTKTEK